MILTTYELDEYVFDALAAGASGFLLKAAPPEDLIRAIQVVAAGNALLDPSVTKRLIAEFAKRPEPSLKRPKELASLTDRERGKSVSVILFASEEDRRKGDETLNAMTPPIQGGMGLLAKPLTAFAGASSNEKMTPYDEIA